MGFPHAPGAAPPMPQALSAAKLALMRDLLEQIRRMPDADAELIAAEERHGRPRQTLPGRVEGRSGKISASQTDDDLQSTLLSLSALSRQASAGPAGPRATSTAMVREALIVRVSRAVSEVAARMSDKAVISAIAKPADMDVFVTMLQDAAPLIEDRSADPLSGAMARAVEHRQSLLAAAGELMTGRQVAEAFGIKPQAVDKRRERHKLFGLKLGSDWRYPAFQFRAQDVLPQLPKVLEALREHDPYYVLDTLLSGDETLGGRSLLDLLQADDDAAIDLYLAQEVGDGFL